MTKEQLKTIFSIPERDLLQFLLNKVNLTEKELKIIDNCLVKGYTEEYTAEIMEMSRNGVQKIKKKAFDKLIKVWDNDRVIHLILRG
jgi:predicted DNA-binding protein (UPF0251 family)